MLNGSSVGKLIGIVLFSTVMNTYAAETAPDPQTKPPAALKSIVLPEINLKNCSDSNFLDNLLKELSNATYSSLSKENLQEIGAFTDKCLLLLKQN